MGAWRSCSSRPTPVSSATASWPTAFTPVLFDTTTGKKLAIPVRGRLTGALYLGDGSLAVRTKAAKIVVVKDGKQVRTIAEPAGIRSKALLQVVSGR